MTVLGAVPIQKHVLVLCHGKISTRPVRSPSQRLEILKAWEEIGVMLRSPSLLFTMTMGEAPQSTQPIQADNPCPGHWTLNGRERFTGKKVDAGVTDTISVNYPFKNFTCRNKSLEEAFSA